MIESLLPIFATGVLFGGSNGISPGPLSVLTISQTMQGGFSKGMKVACSPLITDLPIIVLSLFLFSRMTDRSMALAGISILGALFLFFLAYKSFTFKSPTAVTATATDNPLLQGVVTNFLNPYPYIFWITVGAPYASQLLIRHDFTAVVFFAAFYTGMMTAKTAIVLATVKGRSFLTGQGYMYCMRAIGVIMLFFGVKFTLQTYGYIFPG